MLQPDALQEAIRRLAFGASLTSTEAAAAFGIIMRGEAVASQVAALLMALRVKGETPDEVAGVARALRAAMVSLPSDRPGELVDTCGTGGGTVQTFNISTAAALLAAGAGVRIAKHGNRSFTSRSGSADVLEALGIAVDVPVDEMCRALGTHGIVFMFAPVMHPAMRHVGSIRRELAVPTVMNIVGPLANPAHATRQVIGVAEEARLGLLAGALASLGTTHSLVVHGEPGMDEISPLGRTRVLEVRRGNITEWEINPAQFGISGILAEDLAGGEPETNAALIVETLGGRGNAGATAAVLLNAAAAIYVSGLEKSYESSFERARLALVRGDGIQALASLRAGQGQK